MISSSRLAKMLPVKAFPPPRSISLPHHPLILKCTAAVNHLPLLSGSEWLNVRVKIKAALHRNRRSEGFMMIEAMFRAISTAMADIKHLQAALAAADTKVA